MWHCRLAVGRGIDLVAGTVEARRIEVRNEVEGQVSTAFGRAAGVLQTRDASDASILYNMSALYVRDSSSIWLRHVRRLDRIEQQ